ncbi:AHSP, partial [Cervus elaphus hippelaphus]
MVTVVNDWVSFYINYYKKQMSGEQAEQDKALQEFRQELDTLSASFLDKYRDFLNLAQRDSQRLKSVAETYTAPLDPKMALIQTNKDLISKGIKEFNALLNQQ